MSSCISLAIFLPPVIGKSSPPPSCLSLPFWPNDCLKDEHVTQVGPIRVKSGTCPGDTWKIISLFSTGLEPGKI